MDSGDVELVLVPSPLLGPATWEPVAARLRGWGRKVAVLGQSVGAPTDADLTPQGELARLVAAIPDGRPVVLVPHSNAGLFVAGIAARRHVVGAIFVDAGFPPEEGHVPLAPVAFQEHLRALADADGVLPPWAEWWGENQVTDLFPDASTRRLVEAEQRRMPLSYFTSGLDAPAGWRTFPCAYLAFGDTYAQERDRAMDLGWPVTTITGGHLHLLHEPDRVAEAITALVTRLGLA
ncbi:alpha/beta hydrolase [Georgenia sp. SYP-B2076]|uniref:alpha/beta hydrolase n=1 Tax=Georgenia sp. SYP-B2076 TaxID=2495881 RepID=UPI000F8D288F|nr:alpha/beta hydrolase [Georgenia sp. SYP-B2076]